MNRKLIAGNWKMNGDRQGFEEFVADVTALQSANCDVLVCPPFPLLGLVPSLFLNGLDVGGQDCHTNESGAHTGDTSATLLAELGCSHIIVGHSERRSDHAEASETISQKAQAAISAGLTAIICVGESKQQREAGDAISTVLEQLKSSMPDGAKTDKIVIAYEPVWAIGTGLVASTDDIKQMHVAIRDCLNDMFSTGDKIRILYGGSVKGSNAAEIFAVEHVDGALVGGASLKADSFGEIIAAAQ